jgi:DoxX-like family
MLVNISIMIARRKQVALRGLVAAAWLYEGVWAKLLGRAPKQADIVAAVPWIGARRARRAVAALGVAEAGMAAWALTGRAARATALAQTAVVAAMDAGARRWASAQIGDGRRMLLRHAAFVALVWLAARDARS